MIAPENPDSLYQANRQSPAAIAFILLKYLRRIGRLLIPLVAIWFFQGNDEQGTSYVLTGFLFILVAQMVFAILEYFRYTFQVEGEELIIESGVLGRKRTGIPFDRIQTISFEQNVLHQVLDVVQVNIDTAGSAQTELNIHALSRRKAEELRSFLLSQKEIVVGATEEESSDPEDVRSSPPLPKTAKEYLVFSLGISDLLRVGVTENHLRTAGILLSSILGLWQFYWKDDWFNYMGVLAEEVETAVTLYNTYEALTFTFGLGILLLASFALTMIRTVLRYFDLRLWQTEKGFRLNAGLFNRREQAAARSKIQLIRWYTDPLKQWLGLYTVRLFQAASTEVKTKEAITIPGCYASQRATIVQSMIPAEDQQNYTDYGIDKRIVGRYLIYFGLFPAIALILWSFRPLGGLAAFWLLWLPLCYALVRQYQRKFQWSVNAATLLIRKGVIGTQYSLMAWRKIQAVEVKQSPYQQSHQLATVVLHTAAGHLQIPYISLPEAEALRDHALYKVESDARAWM